jgi:hypothetical protein
VPCRDPEVFVRSEAPSRDGQRVDSGSGGRFGYCLADTLPISNLPFGHGLEVVSGIPKIDAALAQRLATLTGTPVRRTLTVKRQLEGGELIAATSTLVLSEFGTAEIAPKRLDVPQGYRYQEPVVIGPIRQQQ